MSDSKHPNLFTHERVELLFLEDDGETTVRAFKAGYKGKYYVVYEQTAVTLFDVVDKKYFQDKYDFDITEIIPD